MSFGGNYDCRTKNLQTLKSTDNAENNIDLQSENEAASISNVPEEKKIKSGVSVSTSPSLTQGSSSSQNEVLRDILKKEAENPITFYHKNRKIKSSLILEFLQHGIEVSLHNLSTSLDRDLLMADFKTVEMFNLVRKDFAFDFYVYAPVAFSFFREMFGINTEDFIKSICLQPLYLINSGGKSGNDVYATHDDQFILKTVTKKEANFLIKLFPGYFLNITQHPKTLLPKYFGFFSYQNGTQKIKVLVMNNLLPTRIKFNAIYDIKGTTNRNRRNTNINKENNSLPSFRNVLKDVDFLEHWPHGFYLSQKLYKFLMQSIVRDCKVLESFGITDYSLLLGIHMIQEENSILKTTIYVTEKTAINSSIMPLENIRRFDSLIGPLDARTGKGIKVHLYVGIIDILQNFTVKKKLEFYFKSLKFPNDFFSVTGSSFYSLRIQRFLKNSVFKFIPELKVVNKEFLTPDDC